MAVRLIGSRGIYRFLSYDRAQGRSIGWTHPLQRVRDEERPTYPHAGLHLSVASQIPLRGSRQLRRVLHRREPRFRYRGIVVPFLPIAPRVLGARASADRGHAYPRRQHRRPSRTSERSTLRCARSTILITTPPARPTERAFVRPGSRGSHMTASAAMVVNAWRCSFLRVFASAPPWAASRTRCTEHA